MENKILQFLTDNYCDLSKGYDWHGVVSPRSQSGRAFVIPTSVADPSAVCRYLFDTRDGFIYAADALGLDIHVNYFTADEISGGDAYIGLLRYDDFPVELIGTYMSASLSNALIYTHEKWSILFIWPDDHSDLWFWIEHGTPLMWFGRRVSSAEAETFDLMMADYIQYMAQYVPPEKF